jgi:prepilin-type N-terminal cleavage/methylation domain-containing protein
MAAACSSSNLEPPASNNTTRRAFSLIEMLATVAALVIVLGLAVSLARYVRRQASDRLTKDLLAQLDELVSRYQERYQARPVVPPFVADGGGGTGDGDQRGNGQHEGPDALPVAPVTASTNPEATLPSEAELRDAAEKNNKAFVAALRVEARRHPDEFKNLPASFEAGGTLHDAWGTPIVFMPSMHPAVGMAMADKPFFLSAGPDRQFRTLADNLFSYEEGEVGDP